MKPQKSMTRPQLDQVPEPLRELVTGLQLNDPRTLNYALNLALMRLGPLPITPQDLDRMPGQGVLTIGVITTPPTMVIAFVPGDSKVAIDYFTRRHPGKPIIPVDPDLIDKDPKQ